MKSSYIPTIILSLTLCNISAHSKDMCEKGEGFKKPTVRAFNGALCGIKPIAAWAEKNCANTPGYVDSQCHKKAKAVLGNTDIASLTARSTGNEQTIEEILRNSSVTEEDRRLLRKSGIVPPPPTELPPPPVFGAQDNTPKKKPDYAPPSIPQKE